MIYSMSGNPDPSNWPSLRLVEWPNIEDDEDGEDGKIENVTNENFTRESPDLQPIRGRDSSPNPTIANVDLILPTKSILPQSTSQPRLANNDAPPSIGDSSIPLSSPSHDPDSI